MLGRVGLVPRAQDIQETYDVRRATTRGVMRTDWLDARFSFSFGPYSNPQRNNFSALRALNEDIIQPGSGFAMHPHRDLEIFILPLSGAVEHRDSLGNHALVRPHDVQKMSAGTGIQHSQMNASTREVDHHLQIWLSPRTAGLPPSVEQRSFDPSGHVGKWQVLVSSDGREGSLTVDQDAILRRRELQASESYEHRAHSRGALYLHVVRGDIVFTPTNERLLSLQSGDAIAAPRAIDFSITGVAPSTLILLFDLMPTMNNVQPD